MIIRPYIGPPAWNASEVLACERCEGP